MSSVGIKIHQFDVPVCNSFQAKVLNDQLCYEVDLSKLSNKKNINRELKSGLSFILDYNEDRQVILKQKMQKKKDNSLSSTVVEADQDQQAFIYLNTVGWVNCGLHHFL